MDLQGQERCPFQVFKNARELGSASSGHIRLVLDASPLLEDFAKRLNVHQCSFRSKRFLNLGKRTSHCRKRYRSPDRHNGQSHAVNTFKWHFREQPDNYRSAFRRSNFQFAYDKLRNFTNGHLYRS